MKRNLFFFAIAALMSLSVPTQAQETSGKISRVSTSQNQNHTGQQSLNSPILGAIVNVTGGDVTLTSMSITLDGTTDISDCTKIKIYSTGTNYFFNEHIPEGTTLLGEYTPQEGTMVCDFATPITLPTGRNSLWITADISADATEGNFVDATIVSITAESGTYEVPAKTGNPDGNKEILLVNNLLYAPGDNGSVAYRIPAMVILPNGNIVTAIDRRWNSEADLANRIDILARISEDGGYTWSEEYPIAIASDADNGRGDCALVVAPNGDIVAAFVGGNSLWNSSESDPMASFISRSSDGGKTWTPVEEGGEGDITSQIWGSNCNGDDIRLAATSAFFGSGRGLCLTRQTGENKNKNGRIMFVSAINNGGDLYNYAVYSDDNGITWNVSEQAYSNGDEAKVAELNDGTILMSVRRSGGERGYAKSTDGGETWSEQSTWSDLKVNACNGDILEYTAQADGYNINRTLHSLPINDGSMQRSKVSVYLSYDEGETWQHKKQMFPSSSAYSTMIKLPDGTIGMYAEDQQGSTKSYFMRFSLAWLTDGEDIYTAPEPGNVNDMTAPNEGVAVRATKGHITVNSNEPVEVEIFTLGGVLVKAATTTGYEMIAVPAGFYIVKAGSSVDKVIVK